MIVLPEVLTAKQLAAALGPAFDERAIYRLHSHGLPRIRIGDRRVVYDVHAVRGWLESRRVGDWPSERPDLRAVS